MQSVRNFPARLVKLRRRLKLESGGSLPSALITLAVGSLLLTPFLSFVSTRSLGTRAAGETFSEQYAADAGVEFGIWSLLNDLTFRTQVDSSIGTAQPLPFPSPINGYTPSLSVTGILIGNWYERQNHLPAINQGGSLAYTEGYPLGEHRVYALQGNGTKNFGYYSISTDQWIGRADTDKEVGQGGALVYGGDSFIYALRGNNKKEFWRYDIDGNSWSTMGKTPKNVSAGAALAYPGGNFIYALQGGGTDTFWEYSISKNKWKPRKKIPVAVNAGGALVSVGGDTIYAFCGGNLTNFWRYTISTNSWVALQNTDSGVSNGGALAYYSGDYIYALQGNSTGFWRYAVTMDNWTVLEETLNPVGNGGSLVVTHSLGGFAFRGGNHSDFWKFEVTPPQYDISSQAGSVDTDARIEIDGSTNTILFWDID